MEQEKLTNDDGWADVIAASLLAVAADAVGGATAPIDTQVGNL